jgi:hypothetical protein
MSSRPLTEAANWRDSRGIGMWGAHELTPDRMSKEVTDGLFYLAKFAGEPVGTVRFQLSDAEF